MTLAYFSNYFPSLTETFIYREVVELKRRGIEVLTYSLRRPDRSGVSGEASRLHDATYFLLPVGFPCLLSSHLRSFFRNPFRYGATLVKMVLTGGHEARGSRLRSLMHFGEGVVLGGAGAWRRHYPRARPLCFPVGLRGEGRPPSERHSLQLYRSCPRYLVRPAPPSREAEGGNLRGDCSAAARAASSTPRADVSSKVHLVYHGLDLDKFPYSGQGEGRERNLILSIGRLTPEKGFPDLIAACGLLRDRGIAFRCVIVGGGNEQGSWRI